jgi:hypothetical protein
MKLSTLQNRLSQLKAKLRLFVKQSVSRSKKYGLILQILKLEAKIEILQQSSASLKKQKKQKNKEDFSKRPNPKTFRAFLNKFESSIITIPDFEETEYPQKILIEFPSGEISIINYYQLPSDYRRNRKKPDMSADLHGLYAAIGQTLVKR